MKKRKRLQSMKPKAVAKRINDRIKRMLAHGIDTSAALNELSQISGISFSKTGKIVVAKTPDIASISQKAYDIVHQYEREQNEEEKRRKRIAKFEEKLNKRVEANVKKFGFNKQEIADLALDIEGISKNEDGSLYVSDEDLFSDEMVQSAYGKVFTPDELIETVKDDLVENQGLSEGDLENFDDDRIIKEAKAYFGFRRNDSVFSKYYDYFDFKGEGGQGKARKDYRMRAGEYAKAQTAMSELGKIVRQNGFDESYYKKQAQVKALLAGLKTRDDPET